jgi:hypothetical protein
LDLRACAEVDAELARLDRAGGQDEVAIPSQDLSNSVSIFNSVRSARRQLAESGRVSPLESLGS